MTDDPSTHAPSHQGWCPSHPANGAKLAGFRNFPPTLFFFTLCSSGKNLSIFGHPSFKLVRIRTAVPPKENLHPFSLRPISSVIKGLKRLKSVRQSGLNKVRPPDRGCVDFLFQKNEPHELSVLSFRFIKFQYSSF